MITNYHQLSEGHKGNGHQWIARLQEHPANRQMIAAHYTFERLRLQVRNTSRTSTSTHALHSAGNRLGIQEFWMQ